MLEAVLVPSQSLESANPTAWGEDPHQENLLLKKAIEDLSKKISDLQQINKLKDDFLAMLSHELRNPIHVIAGFSEILKSNPEEPHLVREAAEAIYRNSQYQVKLVTDLLDISRSLIGKLVLDTQPIEMSPLLKENLLSARREAEKKNIRFIVDITTMGLIQGDSIRISQVIWNLLSNAIKFTPNGGEVRVQLRQNEKFVEFSVQDNGVGIDDGFLPHLFERFHQQDPSITKKFGGLGLGLAIVKHIVELHQGSISAFSRGVGQGATFQVRLPLLTT